MGVIISALFRLMAQHNTWCSDERAPCENRARYTPERGNRSFSSCQRGIAFAAMIYCTLVQHSLRCSRITASSSVQPWEDNQGRFSHFYSYCDAGICQRLFWLEAVCFQDIKTSTEGILLYYIQYRLVASLSEAKIQGTEYPAHDTVFPFLSNRIRSVSSTPVDNQVTIKTSFSTIMPEPVWL